MLYLQVIGETEAIPSLLKLLNSNSTSSAAQVQAAAAIGVLSTAACNRQVRLIPLYKPLTITIQ